jgi:transposase
MPATKNRIDLGAEDKAGLEQVLKHEGYSRRERQRAQLLVWSAEGKHDQEIARLLGVNVLTVAKTRERWATERRIADAPKAGRKKKLDGKQEAFLVALACSGAPEGRERWTLQMLADRLVELKVINDPISYETVRSTLKKTS